VEEGPSESLDVGGKDHEPAWPVFGRRYIYIQVSPFKFLLIENPIDLFIFFTFLMSLRVYSFYGI
jgi:hypothetical protein